MAPKGERRDAGAVTQSPRTRRMLWKAGPVLVTMCIDVVCDKNNESMTLKYLLLAAAAFAASANAQFLDPQILRDATVCSTGGRCTFLEQEEEERERRDAFWAQQREQLKKEEPEAAERAADKPAARKTQPQPAGAKGATKGAATAGKPAGAK